VVGTVAWLMMHLPTHKYLFLTDLEWMVLPPVAAGQFRLFRKDNMPIGYVSWARLNEDVEERLKQGVTKLQPADWTSGDRLWLVDVIAPFGGKEEIVESLISQIFKGRDIQVLNSKKDKPSMPKDM